MFGKVGLLVAKELRSLWHDKMMVVIVAFSFTFMVYSAATATSYELHNAPIAVVDEDRSRLSERILAAFGPPRFLAPERISARDVDGALDSGRTSFVLDIPPEFERDVVAGRSPALQVGIDATRMSQAFIGAIYIQSIALREIAVFARERAERPVLPVELVARVMFNPNLTGTWFGGAMEIISQVTMLSIVLAGAALIRERERGTLEHLLVMPVSPFQIMASKVLASGGVILAAAAFSLLVVVGGVLGVPIAGSIPLFLLGTAVHLFSTTSIGILLGTLARGMPQLGLLLIFVILPLQLLSGSVTPRESMPSGVQTLMLAAPTTHYVALAQAILYRGAGLGVVWPQLAALAAIGSAVFAASLLRFRRAVSLGEAR